MREGEAPSYFNAQEAAALAELVAGLLQQSAAAAKSGRPAVQPNDLGVIATYRKQARRQTWPPRLVRPGHCCPPAAHCDVS